MPLRTLNRVELLGVVGDDPEVKNLNGGKVLAKIPIGIRKGGGKNEDGTYSDEMDWFTVTAWGREAELVAQNVKKGNDIHIEGFLVKNIWTDKHDQKRYDTEVHIRRAIFLGGKVKLDIEEAGDSTPAPSQGTSANDGAGGFEDPDDDLPF